MLTALVNLNVRIGPGLDYATIGQLVQGQSTQITGKNSAGTWWQIVYPPGNSSQGWVSADPQYTAVGDITGLPIAQAPAPPATAVSPTNTPSATLAISTPYPVPPVSLNWSFADIRLDPTQEQGSLLLYGNMTNISSSAQEVAYVTGTFFDAQGQVIADEDSIYDYWLVDVIPPSGRTPFELTVLGIQNAANLNLRVESDPSDDTPHQNFEFSDIRTSDEAGDYCLSGVVRNLGEELSHYLIIMATLYDRQNRVINFSNYDEPNFEEVVGDDTLDFEICIDSFDQEVTRYELQGWGW
jgi:uncharacterized protein YraI